MNLRSLFLTGCIALALPGIASSGFYGAAAWRARAAAIAAAAGSRAAGDVMRTGSALMVERGRQQEAAFVPPPPPELLAAAMADTDRALALAQADLRSAGLPAEGIERLLDGLARVRERTRLAIARQASLRPQIEQINRFVEGLEEDVSRIAGRVTLASAPIGVVVGLARTASEMRGIAGRRGVLLNSWFGGQALEPAQQRELLILTGRLAEALDRLKRDVRTTPLPPVRKGAVAVMEADFFGSKEPFYRELVQAVAAGADRPIEQLKYRAWHVAALASLLPVRDSFLDEAAAQAAVAIATARRSLLACAGATLLSLALVAAALLALLRGIVAPVQRMTTAMSALAAGDLAAEPPRSRLREIGAMAAALAVFRDNVASLHAGRSELRHTNALFEAALEHMSQGLTMYDAQQRLVVFNRRWPEITGLPPDHIRAGMSYRDVMALAVAAGQFPGLTADKAHTLQARRIAELTATSSIDIGNGARTFSVRATPLAGGGWVSTFEDVTEQRQAEASIVHMAHHDALTGLPNRVLLRERLERAVAGMRPGDRVAVLALDLDGFKIVNDSFGHPVGDVLLCAVADRLRNNARAGDLVARLGGDEFAIIQAGAGAPDDAEQLAARLVEALGLPFIIDGRRIDIGTSIGIVLAGVEATPDALLRDADIALYQAKAAGRGTWRVFESRMSAALLQRRKLETDLRQALAEQQFDVFYQPIVDAAEQAVVGFEALMRWRHPRRGMIPPNLFIPVAEELGLICELGTWVLHRACADAAGWPHDLKVAVNLSPLQFRDGALAGEVARALAAAGLPAHRLELEITESVLLRDTDATLRVLRGLHDDGVRISMDDFGTGYSSLSYLCRFPFDKIKIDQSFVRDVTQDKGSLEIIRAVIGLGHALGLGVLAEGVETREQLALLRAEGCDELQGYLFSRPCPLEELPRIINGLRARPVRRLAHVS